MGVMTEKKEKRYEKPELKTLFNDLQAAVGQCNAGINDSAGCGGGIGPGPATCGGGVSFG
jgi:hypothetical protein